MHDLLDQMRECKSVRARIDLALTDAYGTDEQAVARLTCIETMFGRSKQVKLVDHEVKLTGFDLSNQSILAVCKQGALRWIYKVP